MYDLIGDIHGHARELEDLLTALGYLQCGGVYSHSERKVVFLGDLIDRGPQIRRVLEIVRPMVEAGAALAVMGNHELNALAYHTPDASRPSESLRPHTPKNNKQHQETLQQIPAGELAEYLAWFRTLPLWLELDGLRVVHACWDEPSLSQVKSNWSDRPILSETALESMCRRDGELFASVEILLKGKEIRLPKGVRFLDAGGHERDSMRTKWFLAIKDLSSQERTYRMYALQAEQIDCDRSLEDAVVESASFYPPHAKPVFFGHYWLRAARPEILAPNVACVDYSVAKGGFLCAYRWQGEQTLSNENFVWTTQ